MSDLKAIADKLVELCRTNQEAEGLKTLYAPDAVSVEAFPNPGSGSAVTKGVEGIQGKHDWWNSAMEVHSVKIDGPFLHGEDRFAVIFEMDATEREKSNRFQMKEVAIYTVKDSKIVREEFFYAM